MESETVLTTVTNYGYLLYTLNMLKSLSPWGMDKKVHILCLDERSHRVLTGKGYNATLSNITIAQFCHWNKKGYDKICYLKLSWIYQLLTENKNVLLMDGDIVFRKNPMEDMISWNQEETEVWIQNDGKEDTDTSNLCTGYIYIKTTDNMKQLYDCISEKGVKQYAVCAGINNDQSYFNDFIKPYCKVKVLPLAQYPNGRTYYKQPDTDPILIHFNWVIGHFKMAKMKEHRMWLLLSSEERF
jgi:hypothetical protein